MKLKDKKQNNTINTDNRLKRRFRAEALKYRSWTLKHGYNSRQEITLLWYFNRKGRAFKNGKGYYILYRDKKYPPEELMPYFRNGYH